MARAEALYTSLTEIFLSPSFSVTDQSPQKQQPLLLLPRLQRPKQLYQLLLLWRKPLFSHVRPQKTAHDHRVHQIVKLLGKGVVPDGKLGADTHLAIGLFQEKLEWTPDYIAGVKTVTELLKA